MSRGASAVHHQSQHHQDRIAAGAIGGNREKLADWLRSAPEEDVVSVKEVSISEPERARIMASVTCEFCGEGMMKTRAKEIDGKLACIPCAEQI